MTTNDSRSIGYSFMSLLNEHIDKDPQEILTILSQSEDIASNCDELISLLTRSVKERVDATPSLCKNCAKIRFLNGGPKESIACNHPKVGILFSGGIDCTILAVLTNQFVDETNAIDLINVSFEKIVRSSQSIKQLNPLLNLDDCRFC